MYQLPPKRSKGTTFRATVTTHTRLQKLCKAHAISQSDALEYWISVASTAARTRYIKPKETRDAMVSIWLTEEAFKMMGKLAKANELSQADLLDYWVTRSWEEEQKSKRR